MKTLLALLTGAIIGLVAIYFVVVTIACDWIFPGANLCGIYGVFAAPFGAVIGAVCGWLIVRPRKPGS